LGFFAAAEAEKDLAAHEMDILAVRGEFLSRVEGNEGFAIFSLALIKTSQAEERSGLAGIVAKGFAEKVLGFFVLLQL